LSSLVISVDVAKSYGVGGPGIEPRCERDFLHTTRKFLGPTQPHM